MSVRLVAFDLDGTLIRGRNSLTVVGHGLGHPEWSERMEIIYMRGRTADEMRARVAPWLAYAPHDLCRHLVESEFAPGVDEAFGLLHARGIVTAIVSISWSFIVEWFARRFGAAHWVAVGLAPDGTVAPFWPEDKGPWLERLMAELGLGREHVAAVGDSPRDASLLRAAGHAFYVGAEDPEAIVAGAHHHPDGDLAAIARTILHL